jgi:23S rRNA (guanosine2251-2'-O)-methyltransferase
MTARQPRPRREERAGRGNDEVVVLYGWHPVVEALRNERRPVRRLLATENSANRLQEAIPDLRIQPELVRPHDISRLVEPDAVHQGLYLEADPLPSPTLETLPDSALVLALDQITDPHNVGAIVRTAAAFKVDAILTTARHSPSATGVLAKSASGGLEHVPFVIVRNLAEALIALGERGFQRIGLDSDAGTPLDQVDVRRPLVVALGAEGKGLRRRTKECCDVVGRLDMPGAIKSLNVSNATAITLYALTRSAPG